MRLQMFLVLSVVCAAVLLITIGCVSQKGFSIETVEAQTTTQEDKLKTAKATKRTPVIVELFTSEGCSSCPPADKILASLDRSQQIETADVIVLSEHVDYWNRLGWTDPFSKAQFSNRQNEYSQFFKRNDVYTPQMVVDGTTEFVGGNAGKAIESIEAAAKGTKGDLTIEVVKNEKNAVELSVKIANLPKLSAGDSAIVLLAVTEDKISTNVSRGENAGETLPHSGVVRYLQNIGSVSGDKAFAPTLVLQKDWKQNNLNVVAFVQETNSRKILGAVKIKLAS